MSSINNQKTWKDKRTRKNTLMSLMSKDAH